MAQEQVELEVALLSFTMGKVSREGAKPRKGIKKNGLFPSASRHRVEGLLERLLREGGFVTFLQTKTGQLARLTLFHAPTAEAVSYCSERKTHAKPRSRERGLRKKHVVPIWFAPSRETLSDRGGTGAICKLLILPWNIEEGDVTPGSRRLVSASL